MWNVEEGFHALRDLFRLLIVSKSSDSGRARGARLLFHIPHSSLIA
jgi:hypothetical protein